jgi:hypothetical protein
MYPHLHHRTSVVWLNSYELAPFSQAKDPMDAEDWLKGVEKKLMIA